MNISFDVKGDFNATLKWLNDVTHRKPSVVLQEIANEGTRSLADNTPRATGATANGWKAEVSDEGIVWTNTAHPESAASVAKLIELGHHTRTHGYVPPRPYIKAAMAPVWNDVDKKLEELIK